MKVVYNPNKNQEELFRVTCDNCESVMEVTRGDCHVGTWGMPQVTCPVCSEECVVEELCGDMTQEITSLTVQYPIHFSKMPDKAYKLPDSEITNGVKHVLKDLEDNGTPGTYSIYGTGNVVVLGTMSKDDIIVYVCKDYDELWIPLKEED